MAPNSHDVYLYIHIYIYIYFYLIYLFSECIFCQYEILPLACFWPMAANDNHLFVDKAAACFSFPVVLVSKIEEDVKHITILIANNTK